MVRLGQIDHSAALGAGDLEPGPDWDVDMDMDMGCGCLCAGLDLVQYPSFSPPTRFDDRISRGKLGEREFVQSNGAFPAHHRRMVIILG